VRLNIWKINILILATVCAVPALHAQTVRSADDYLNSAIKHIQSKEPDKALSDLDEVIKINPKYVAAFLFRADIRYQKGDIDGALSDYNIAIEVAPDAPGMEIGYNNRSLIQLAKNNLTAALVDINKAIKLNPPDCCVL
jgi:tetratricopeptide (TPR) repeat protein